MIDNMQYRELKIKYLEKISNSLEIIANSLEHSEIDKELTEIAERIEKDPIAESQKSTIADHIEDEEEKEASV